MKGVMKGIRKGVEDEELGYQVMVGRVYINSHGYECKDKI